MSDRKGVSMYLKESSVTTREETAQPSLIQRLSAFEMSISQKFMIQ